MKKLFFLAALVFMALAPVFSQSNKDLKHDMEEARDSKHDIFIEMNDGKIATYEKLKIKAGVMGYEHFEADGKKLDIPFDSVKSYQTDEYYAVRIDSTPKIHVGKMPAAELFAMRIRMGKIELFYSYRQKEKVLGVEVYSSDKKVSYFLRKGKNASLVPLSKATLKLMVADKKGVLEEFDDVYKKRNEYDSATKILDDYN